MLAFKANFITPAYVQRVNDNSDVSKKVSFVEMNPLDKNDILSINKAAVHWDRNGGEGFAFDICKSVNDIYSTGVNEENKQFFAITTQRDSFPKIDPDEIIALAQVTTPDSNSKYIDYLQIEPESQESSYLRRFKRVGTAMLNSLKELFHNKNITLDSVESAVNFYLKNGFVETTPLRMVFKR